MIFDPRGEFATAQQRDLEAHVKRLVEAKTPKEVARHKTEYEERIRWWADEYQLLELEERRERQWRRA